MSIHGGNLQAARHKYGRQNFIDFSANINPLGPPSGVYKAIENNLNNIIHYPDPDCAGLKAALSRKLQVPQESIVLGNGAVELIYQLAQALAPRKVLIPVPTFGEYARAVSVVNAKPQYHHLAREDNFKLKPHELNLQDSDLMFVCNPNNPTGQLMAEQDFIDLLEMAHKHGTFVLVDESFMDFVEPASQWRAHKYLADYERLFVLYSLTKFYAIPGLRVGCGICRPELAHQLASLSHPWNINNLAQAAAEAALQDEEYDYATRNTIAVEREYLIKQLEKFSSLAPLRGAPNFLLVKNFAATNGGELVEKLGYQGILIRDCSNFPGLGPKYFRIAVKDRSSNDQLLLQLKKFLD